MNHLFDIEHLSIAFPEEIKGTRKLAMQTVVNDISFSIEEGEILGIVGESGAGKSMTALAAMGLLSSEARVMGGSIRFEGREILSMSEEEQSRIRGNDISMIFQEPMTSLNPVMKIGTQVGETLKLHTALGKDEIHQKVVEALADVGLPDPEALYGKYPHELSGGMRQRVMIAQAMICEPKLLIADEPTTALDVLVQQQILELLLELHRRRKVAILFISHDLHVIRKICHNVLVMYNGQIVERGEVRRVLEHPEHEYTKTLVASFPENPGKVTTQTPALSLQHVNVYYEEKNNGFWGKKERRRVVKDVSFSVKEGELFGIVGESGCGKSTLAKAIVGLNPDYDGEIAFLQNGEVKGSPQNGSHGKSGRLHAGNDAFFSRPQMVFQDPFSSLNPAHKIGWIMTEPLRVLGIRDRKEQRRLVEEMLADVGLDLSFYDRYPRELSGGQRQRVSIGTALLRQPRILVADEPVSALDVTIQSQILDLLLELHQKRKLTIVFISHDLNLVRHICSRVAVLYFGELVEIGDVEEVYRHPRHEYTKKLLEAAL
ncbi:MAG: ABC transporter ATP-binding protein [Lachnospiraceae bacterium]|nr:ABC transporter ATP-binding protein [Lachnospiraceae bacterium]